MTQKAASHNTPKVSVVMATYNRAHLLPHAIRSIISQTLTDWELIIVDDASSDNTQHVAQTFTQHDSRIRYHRHKHNSGLAVARNTSTELARGRYIALHDDDDISLPQRLQTQADFLDQNPHVHLVSNRVRRFDRRGFISTSLPKRWVSNLANVPSIDSLAIMPITTGCAMGHRNLFTQEPTRAFFLTAEDYDFVLRCIDKTTIMSLPNILYHHRQKDKNHKTSIGTDPRDIITLWKYHTAAWLSAYYRRHGMTDPIDSETPIDDILHNAKPILKNLRRYPHRKLIFLRLRRILRLSLKRNDLTTYRTTLMLVLQYSTYRTLCRITLYLIPHLIRYPRAAFYRDILRALLTPRHQNKTTSSSS
ncbi:MAG: glycosyltransferase family 2 protein [Alphaproteobacteria bacterium GM202ARS2]|nr:glycosyltransferase family 2 protein [Alphaproteobacteria bacterium GM202ARS2]